jgi:hypothetical protein
LVVGMLWDEPPREARQRGKNPGPREQSKPGLPTHGVCGGAAPADLALRFSGSPTHRPNPHVRIRAHRGPRRGSFASQAREGTDGAATPHNPPSSFPPGPMPEQSICRRRRCRRRHHRRRGASSQTTRRAGGSRAPGLQRTATRRDAARSGATRRGGARRGGLGDGDRLWAAGGRGRLLRMGWHIRTWGGQRREAAAACGRMYPHARPCALMRAPM